MFFCTESDLPGTAKFGDVDLADRGYPLLQARPEPQSAQDLAGGLVQRQGSIVVTGLFGSLRCDRLQQHYRILKPGQCAGQAGANQATTHNGNIIFAGAHCAMSASMS